MCPGTCGQMGHGRLLFNPLCLWFPDAISATNPRVIDDSRARKLSNDLKRCTYYETCATYGLNVERVFQDGNCSRWRVSGRDRAAERGLHRLRRRLSARTVCCRGAEGVRHTFVCSAVGLRITPGPRSRMCCVWNDFSVCGT